MQRVIFSLVFVLSFLLVSSASAALPPLPDLTLLPVIPYLHTDGTTLIGSRIVFYSETGKWLSAEVPSTTEWASTSTWGDEVAFWDIASNPLRPMFTSYGFSSSFYWDNGQWFPGGGFLIPNSSETMEDNVIFATYDAYALPYSTNCYTLYGGIHGQLCGQQVFTTETGVKSTTDTDIDIGFSSFTPGSAYWSSFHPESDIVITSQSQGATIPFTVTPGGFPFGFRLKSHRRVTDVNDLDIKLYSRANPTATPVEICTLATCLVAELESPISTWLSFDINQADTTTGYYYLTYTYQNDPTSVLDLIFASVRFSVTGDSTSSIVAEDLTDYQRPFSDTYVAPGNESLSGWGNTIRGWFVPSDDFFAYKMGKLNNDLRAAFPWFFSLRDVFTTKKDSLINSTIAPTLPTMSLYGSVPMNVLNVSVLDPYIVQIRGFISLSMYLLLAFSIFRLKDKFFKHE